jgi:hypothetical protein
MTFTFSQGTGFKAPKDFAKQLRLELTGKHEKFAMFVILVTNPLHLAKMIAKMSTSSSK